MPEGRVRAQANGSVASQAAFIRVYFSAGKGYNFRMRAVLAVLFLISCLGTSFAKDTKTVDPLREAFVTAFNKGDAATMEKLFEPDMLLFTFTGQPVKGGAAIAKGMAGTSSQHDLDLKPLQSRESGDMLYEAGTWNHYAKGTKSLRQTGTYIWVWKKEKEGWRIESMSVTAASGTPIGQ